MSEQIDIAVDLGVVPPPLPEIMSLRQLVEAAPMPPPQIIEGVLHQGCKMVLGGTSKSNKSRCLLDLADWLASMLVAALLDKGEKKSFAKISLSQKQKNLG